MKIKRTDLIVITEDHGGYKDRCGFCIVCKQYGWKIEHKKGCPVNSKKKYLEVK